MLSKCLQGNSHQLPNTSEVEPRRETLLNRIRRDPLDAPDEMLEEGSASSYGCHWI